MTDETPQSGQDLRLQLVPLEMIPHNAPDRLRDAGAGLVTRLVRRAGSGVAPVQRGEALELAGADAFDVAAEQTYRAELSGLDVRDHTIQSVTVRMLAIDGSAFVTTALLWADVAANFPGMVNAIVAAPRLSAVLVKPVVTRSDIGAATTLASTARAVIADVDDPCTDVVFWWHRGRFHRIEFDDGDQQPVLAAELGPIVEALPA